MKKLFTWGSLKLGRCLFVLQKYFKREVFYSVYGAYFVNNENDFTFKCYIQGSYGFYFSNFIKSYPKDYTFFDVGANQGLYSILALRNPRLYACHAFEPVGTVSARLQQNCEANKLQTNKLNLHKVAISDKVGLAEIIFDPTHSGSSTLRENVRGERVNVNLVDERYLDKHCEVTGDLVLKIDVEGHEFNVLQTFFKSRFADQITHIFLEIDASWSEAIKIDDFLSIRGFKEITKVGSADHYDVLYTKVRG
jgi:FkbM family methyltransferase